MRADLHLHTWTSDGDVSPAEVVRLAAAARLDVIAITDHDTAAGVAEALIEAERLPLTVIPGIEISTMWEAHELHILGYFIDPASEPMLRHQTFAGRRRFVRMEAMIERLRTLGVEVSMADVERAAGPSTRTLGRPHLARALLARGHTRYYSEAFSRFIGDAGPAYVAEGFPLPEDAVRTIHAAGGLAVWAHPSPAWFLDGIEAMVAWGIDGVECFRPGLEPADVTTFESVTRLRGLFPTGGSDWHGPQRFTLGEFAVPAERIAEVLALGGVRS
jgi:predicted metal-dependent phosphoesterase TrpH